MSSRRIIVVGGGAAGFFAAIASAEACPEAQVVVLEKSARFLEKVRISGGGRCNVTHACFESRDFATRYPRGEKALLSPFQKFSARETVEWFAGRGVQLKTESDGRMFPVTDSSETIVECLINAATKAGVKLELNRSVVGISKLADGTFNLKLADGSELSCDRLLLATGGCRVAAAGQLAVLLGHSLVPPVPSLFTFQIETEWLRSAAGISVPSATLSIPSATLRQRGPLMITHWGLSGPAVLVLSAWGARALHDVDYHFPLLVNWVPDLNPEQLQNEIGALRKRNGARLVVNTAVSSLTARLWEYLVLAAGIHRETRWSALKRGETQALIQQLSRTEFNVVGKSLNKDEFVTCGGVKLSEVDFKTMQSKICPGLFFAGELLDIDGVTGGFNFQAAWTTGYLAGKSMAAT
jgi:predicted Rossmann fold flavoprotein